MSNVHVSKITVPGIDLDRGFKSGTAEVATSPFVLPALKATKFVRVQNSPSSPGSVLLGPPSGMVWILIPGADIDLPLELASCLSVVSATSDTQTVNFLVL